MNLEFLLLVSDYFKILTKRDFWLEFGLSALIGVSIFLVGGHVKDIATLAGTISSNSISLLGILIGFSIAVITLITTTDSPNVSDMKIHPTDYRIGTKNLSLFDLQLINYTYSVVVEVLLVIINIILLCAYSSIASLLAIKIINAANVFLIAHALLLTVKNTSNFYFILTRKVSKTIVDTEPAPTNEALN